jgi:hypothetical protein
MFFRAVAAYQIAANPASPSIFNSTSALHDYAFDDLPIEQGYI